MAIKEFISLEGVEQVKRSLDTINVAGEQSLGIFRGLGTADIGGGAAGVTSQFDKFVAGAKNAGLSLQETESATHRFREALHLLHPVFAAAGIQFNEFRALSAAAGVGIAGLAVAISGAIIVAFAKLEENASRTRGVLADLFQSNAKGDEAFALLNAGAKEFGTTVARLVPGLESFQLALSKVSHESQGFVALKSEDLPFGGPKNVSQVTEAYNNFIKILRAGRLSQDDAEKSAKAFFDTLKNGGPVSRAALENLPVGTVKLLQDAMGAAGLSTREFFKLVDDGNVTTEKLKIALGNFGPQAEKAFETKAINTFSDELGKMLQTLSGGFKSISGGKGFSDFVIGELRAIREGIDSTITDIENFIFIVKKLRDFDTEMPGLGKLVTDLRGGAGRGLLQPGEPIPIPTPRPEEAGKAGEAAAAAFNEGFLKKGFVFPPTATQKAGDDAAANFGKGFIDNKFFKPEGATTIVEPFKSQIEKSLATITVPDEAQRQLVENFRQAGEPVGAALREGVQRAPDFSSWLAAIDTFVSDATSKVQTLWQNIQAQFNQPIIVQWQFSGNPFFSQQPTNLATGGLLRGAGTGTSDSILAWLSDYEFVVKSAAVKFYGPELFAALNAMRLPRDFLSKFNMGGLARVISGAMPRFAEGGQVAAAGSRSLTLVLDGQKFGLKGASDVIDRLERVATMAGAASIGRPPGWVK